MYKASSPDNSVCLFDRYGSNLAECFFIIITPFLVRPLSFRRTLFTPLGICPYSLEWILRVILNINFMETLPVAYLSGLYMYVCVILGYAKYTNYRLQCIKHEVYVCKMYAWIFFVKYANFFHVREDFAQNMRNIFLCHCNHKCGLYAAENVAYFSNLRPFFGRKYAPHNMRPPKFGIIQIFRICVETLLYIS